MSQKILLIDDDALVLKTVERLLSSKGYKVDAVPSALEAVSKAANTDYDLVISDVRMPGENGIIAIEKIKGIYSQRRHICGYMFLSGYIEEDTPAHAIRLGINKFLQKPFESDEFFKSIADELALVQNARELNAATLIHPPNILLRHKSTEANLKRAVITGVGSVAPSGIGKKAYWSGLREGKNCVDRITSFDISTYPSKMAAEVQDLNPADFIFDYSEIKRMARSSHLGVAAARLALEDSKLASAESQLLSVIIGSATTGIEYVVSEVRALERGGIRRMKPFLGIAGFGGALSSEISRAIGAQGPSYTISTGCTSSTDAMGYALRQIQHGLAETIITGGADACVNEGILGAFCQMGAVSTRNDKKASRPFNKDRDGFVISEGSWIFVLEELQHALNRNAYIYGELVGYGATCDAWHMAKPHPSGEFTARAVQLALIDAQLFPEQIDVFEAYGNATPVNDSYETAVVKKVFGKHASKIVMPSVKSMLGHPIGAAGGQQMAAALMAINEDFIHPTINYEIPDPECDLDYVPNKGRSGKFDAIVCNSLAFGGKNASLVIKKY